MWANYQLVQDILDAAKVSMVNRHFCSGFDQYSMRVVVALAVLSSSFTFLFANQNESSCSKFQIWSSLIGEQVGARLITHAEKFTFQILDAVKRLCLEH